MSIRHGCYDTPRTFDGKYMAQTGYSTIYLLGRSKQERTPIYTEVQSRFKPGCKYDKADTDAGCAGCCNQPKE